MNRSSMSILARILAEKNNMTISEAETFIKQMFEVANSVMQADKQLKIRWLGTFKVMSVKDRESVDVNTGERIVIGGRDKITFTPDNILKEIVNNLLPSSRRWWLMMVLISARLTESLPSRPKRRCLHLLKNNRLLKSLSLCL